MNDSLKKKIKHLIADNKTEEAIIQLLKLSEGQSYNDLHILKAKYQKLKREKRLYLASRNQLSVDYARLNDSLLQMVDEIFGSKQKAIPVFGGQLPLKKNLMWKRITQKITQSIIILVVVLIMIGFAFKYFGNSNDKHTSSVTILVKSENNIPLPPKGEVYLNYGGEEVRKEINNHNQAIFTEIPNGYFSTSSPVKISFRDPQGEPYYAFFEDSVYQLRPNESIELLVVLKGLDRIYGIVKDFETGDYIEDARISVLNLETYSDKNGWWEIDIKENNKQRKFHTVRASKEGYQNWEEENIPAQTEREITILLKRR